MAFALSARAPIASARVNRAAARPAGAVRVAAPAVRRTGLAPSRFAPPAPVLFVTEAKKSVGDLKKADLEGKVVLVSCAGGVDGGGARGGGRRLLARKSEEEES